MAQLPPPPSSPQITAAISMISVLNMVHLKLRLPIQDLFLPSLDSSVKGGAGASIHALSLSWLPIPIPIPLGGTSGGLYCGIQTFLTNYLSNIFSSHSLKPARSQSVRSSFFLYRRGPSGEQSGSENTSVKILIRNPEKSQSAAWSDFQKNCSPDPDCNSDPDLMCSDPVSLKNHNPYLDPQHWCWEFKTFVIGYIGWFYRLVNGWNPVLPAAASTTRTLSSGTRSLGSLYLFVNPNLIGEEGGGGYAMPKIVNNACVFTILTPL